MTVLSARREDIMTRTISLSGTCVEVVERGQGRALLFLHPGQGLEPDRPWLDLLAERYRVIAPWHPGYGNSPLVDNGAGGVGDLAYLYLDLAAELGLEDAILVGSCLGGWIAAEMMVRSTARFSGVVLAAPLGIKLSGRDERDIADMHAMLQDEYLRSAWADPAKGRIDFAALPDSELAAIVRGREAFAIYGWKPYMHNPHLKRWLHRIDLPTLLLWGAEDGIVTPSYGEGWQRAIPGATMEIIPSAGHFPHWEQPEQFVQRLSAFIDHHNA
jgi:pimeloyl-ACP methyl ester carboxylesterase